ncbi:MAG: hypothetical protein H7A06_05400 [Pseudomonadales bacterium]|nr:hypothetical protein [Pseudomonadales bacterium]
MKSQDVGLLLKLVSMRQLEEKGLSAFRKAWPHDWQDWIIGEGAEEIGEWDHVDYGASRYSVRALEHQTGISKSQINLSLNRCIDLGLARIDRRLEVPRVNSKALLEFIVYGLKYVFPAKAGELTRGIATSFGAPVLKEKLLSSGEFQLVWPDALGKTMGMHIEPLFKSTVYAVKQDPQLYALMALVDAIRLGQPRESNLAADLLKSHMGV